MLRPLFRAFLFCVVLTGVAACANDAAFKPPQRVPPPDPHTQMSALEHRIVELVDSERTKLAPNAKPLRLDSELVGVARRKSADMSQHDYLAHVAPSGATTATIIMDEDAKFQGLLGENIAAQHYTKLGGVDVDAFAKRFVDVWLASPQHRENLLFRYYDRTGVGAAVNGDTVYVTQLFATDMGLPPPPDDASAQTAKPGPAVGRPVKKRQTAPKPKPAMLNSGVN